MIWFFWIAAFAIIEGVALVNKRQGDTLSEQMRRVLGIAVKQYTWQSKLRFLAGLWFFAWLTVHILTGRV